MFYASLLVCFIGVTGPQCMIAEDQRGPYREVTACHARLEEMTVTVLREIPFSSIRGKICRYTGNLT